MGCMFRLGFKSWLSPTPLVVIKVLERVGLVGRFDTTFPLKGLKLSLSPTSSVLLLLLGSESPKSPDGSILLSHLDQEFGRGGEGRGVACYRMQEKQKEVGNTVIFNMNK